MSISIIFIHVNNFSIILICNEKTGIFFWYKLQYIERLNCNPRFHTRYLG